MNWDTAFAIRRRKSSHSYFSLAIWTKKKKKTHSCYGDRILWQAAPCVDRSVIYVHTVTDKVFTRIPKSMPVARQWLEPPVHQCCRSRALVHDIGRPSIAFGALPKSYSESTNGELATVELVHLVAVLLVFILIFFN